MKLRSFCPQLKLAMIFGSLILGADKLSSKAQTFESLQTNPQALNSLSKCKLVMLKVRNHGGNDTKERKIFLTSQRFLESPLAWGPENESSSFDIPKLPHFGSLEF